MLVVLDDAIDCSSWAICLRDAAQRADSIAICSRSESIVPEDGVVVVLMVVVIVVVELMEYNMTYV